MSRKIRPDVVTDVAQGVLQTLVDVQGGTLADYACTLVALLLSGDEVMTCHIGDGAIFVLEGEHPRCLSMPFRGDDGGTQFVTSRGVQPRMFSYDVPLYWTGFLCVSDGAQPALYNAVTGACSPLVTEAVALSVTDDDALEAFACEALQPRSDDDITLVRARRNGIAGLYGCPHCHAPTVDYHVRTARSSFFGVCRSCVRDVFRFEGTAETELFEREARRRGVTLSIRIDDHRGQAWGRPSTKETLSTSAKGASLSSRRSPFLRR